MSTLSIRCRMSLSSRASHAVRAVVRHSPLADPLRRLIRRDPLQGIFDLGRRCGWDAAAAALIGSTDLDRLLPHDWHARLRRTINTDIATELLLTAVRRRLVIGGVQWCKDAKLSDLVATLLQQCINNELVWRASREEHIALDWHAEQVQSRPRWVVFVQKCLYDRIERVAAEASAGAELYDEMPDVFRGIVSAALDEATARRSWRDRIPSIGSAEDGYAEVVSLYEEYPYPRWLDWQIPSRGTRRLDVAAWGGDAAFADPERPLDVLVAGCGTGSKAIAYAFGYGDHTRITGIDLSRASLAYAAVMAEKYGVRSLELLRANLLESSRLGRQFDIVECTGVLHHLPDPEAGLAALAEVTKPGGLVHISLYSELARTEIARLRRGHEVRIGDISDDEVRAFRWNLMQDDPDAIDRRLSLRWDFFDLVRCRDLLFHPLEHRYTIPEALALLHSAGLEFCTIEPPPPPLDRLWVRYPSGEELRNPQAWHQFELRYPEAFGNLYEIWARKPA